MGTICEANQNYQNNRNEETIKINKEAYTFNDATTIDLYSNESSMCRTRFQTIIEGKSECLGDRIFL